MVESLSRPEQCVVEAIAVFPEVRRVILFGSRARGDNSASADIDLAVETEGMSAAKWFDMLAAADEASTLLKVDLVRLDEAPSDLTAAIQREGRVIYERA